MIILFLHGWHSVPGGVKPTYLAQHAHTVINPKLPDEDFDEAVRIAQAEFDKHQPGVVVGSSRGGAVAMNYEGGSLSCRRAFGKVKILSRKKFGVEEAKEPQWSGSFKTGKMSPTRPTRRTG